MKAASIERVQEHFDTIRPRSQQFVQRFYELLFEARPVLRHVFPQDRSKLYLHFEETLVVVIDNLGRIGTVDSQLQDLGTKHLQWGAVPDHYLAARDALLRSLEEQSGARWNEQLAADWRAAVNAIIVPMLRSAAIETARIAQALTEERGIAVGPSAFKKTDGKARTAGGK